MTVLAWVYLGAWVAATLVAIGLWLRSPREVTLLSRAHRRALRTPWKLATFGIAAGFFVLVAPLSGDPTWDYVDAALMSGLTYLTAPWAVGTLQRGLRGRSPRRALYVAVVAWCFSASFSYDGWLVIRDGRYPPTWAQNLLVSSILYIAAGLFWSLTEVPGRGVVFAFQLDPWPPARDDASYRLGLIALLFVGLVAGMMSPFALSAWHSLRR